MVIPEAIKIGGLVYTVEPVDEVSPKETLWAQVLHKELRITYDRKLHPLQVEIMILHEMFHVISAWVELDINEKQTERLAACLHMVMKDNPMLFAAGRPSP